MISSTCFSCNANLAATNLRRLLRWGFLAIYFVPGLTEDQLNDYIRRLAPDRYAFLNRRGMGHLLGDRFMRVLVGERRWNASNNEAVAGGVPTIEPPLNDELVVTTRSRALDLNPDDSVSQASAGPVGLTVPQEAPSNTITNRQEGSEERRRELQGEMDVIAAAVRDGIWNYVTTGISAASQIAADEILQPLGGIATAVGLVGSVGVTVMSLGATLWQYSRPTNGAAGQQSTRRVSGFLFSTTLIGGVSTGVMLYARSALRKATKPPPKPQK